MKKKSLYSNEAKIKPTGLRSKGSKLLPINVRVSALVVFTDKNSVRKQTANDRKEKGLC